MFKTVFWQLAAVCFLIIYNLRAHSGAYNTKFRLAYVLCVVVRLVLIDANYRQRENCFGDFRTKRRTRRDGPFYKFTLNVWVVPDTVLLRLFISRQ